MSDGSTRVAAAMPPVAFVPPDWATLLTHAMQHMSTGVMIYQLVQSDDPGSLQLVFANHAMERVAGFAIGAETGRTIVAIFPNALESGLAAIYAEVAHTSTTRDLGIVSYGDARVAARQFAVQALSPGPGYVTVLVDDVTAQAHAETALRQALAQEATISAQRATLAALSTPLIPVHDQIVVLPLIGALDTQRANQVQAALLAGIAAQRAQVAIVDITGVPVMDTLVARALVLAAQSVRLLGASVILTGMRPEIAQTLVGLGAELAGMVTCSTLQQGIQIALVQVGGVRRA